MGIGNLDCFFSLFVFKFGVTYKFKKDFNMSKGNEKVICVMEAQLHLHYKKRLGAK